MTGSFSLPTNMIGAFKIVGYNCTLPTDIQGMGTIVLNEETFGITPIPGYSLIGVIRYDIGHKGLAFTSCAANNSGKVYITLTNRLSSPQGYTYLIRIECLWVKSELLA